MIGRPKYFVWRLFLLISLKLDLSDRNSFFSKIERAKAFAVHALWIREPKCGSTHELKGQNFVNEDQKNSNFFLLNTLNTRFVNRVCFVS